MKKRPLYYIIFKDGSQYSGGNSYDDSKWNKMPNKKIDRIFYQLPDGNTLVLNGYEKYVFLIEYVTDFNMKGQQLGGKRIECIYLMGKRGNIVTSYRITMFHGKPGKDKFRRGDILRREFSWNQISKKYSGWK